MITKVGSFIFVFVLVLIPSNCFAQGDDRIFALKKDGISAVWRVLADDDGWYRLPPESQDKLLFLDLTNRPVDVQRRLLKGPLKRLSIESLAIGGEGFTESDIIDAFSIPGIRYVVVDAPVELPKQLADGVDIWRSDRYLIKQLVAHDALLRVLAKESKKMCQDRIPLELRLKIVEITRGREAYPVWANPLPKSLLAELHYCDMLRCLDLGGSQVADSDLKRLTLLPRLEVLWLDSTNISGRGLEALSDSQLKRLDLSCNSLSLLPSIKSLEQLNLRSVKISADELPNLQRFPKLKNVDLRGTYVSTEYLDRAYKHFEVVLDNKEVGKPEPAPPKNE